tara:strand:+ start:150 stop:473 length:324 start_codon:yes stop_codon:yes gene_type:complete
MSRFLVTRNKGFRMTFENGFAISVQWGPENYCDRKNEEDFDKPMDERFWESRTAEIAVFNKEGEFIGIADNAVVGWLTTDKVAKCITVVQSATTKEEIETKLKALNI